MYASLQLDIDNRGGENNKISPVVRYQVSRDRLRQNLKGLENRPGRTLYALRPEVVFMLHQMTSPIER